MLRIPIFILFLGIFGLNLYAQGNSPTITQKNGKYGLIDENGNVLVENECDTIYSNSGDYKNAQDILGMIRPFFILKKSSKYAYAYNSSKDYIIPERLLDKQWHWVVSDFVYDDLQQYSFDEKFYIFAVKYRIKNKWGIFYSYYTRVRDSRLYHDLCYYPSGFAKLQATEAVYDSIGKRYEDGILDVVKNGKYSLVYLSPPNAHIDYGGDFDTIPSLLYKSYKEPIPFIRQIREDGKYGMVKLDFKKNEIEYLMDCECEHQIKNLSNKLLICEKTDYGKIAVFDIKNNKKFEIAALNKPLYNYKVISIDSVPDNKQEAHKTYLMLGFGTFDIVNNTYNKGSELYFIDLEIQKLKTAYNDTSLNYNFYDGTHGVLVLKKINTQKGLFMNL